MYRISFSLLTDMNSWSVTMRVDHRSRVLMTIFGPKRDVVIGEWKILRTEKLHDLYSSPNFIPVIK